jgi:hypothetical protein
MKHETSGGSRVHFYAEDPGVTIESSFHIQVSMYHLLRLLQHVPYHRYALLNRLRRTISPRPCRHEYFAVHLVFDQLSGPSGICTQREATAIATANKEPMVDIQLYAAPAAPL